MRILLLNANTDAGITEKLLTHARAQAPDATFIGATARLGARYIASRAAAAIAAHAALDAFAAHGAGCDAVLLACFGDPGLDALREVAGVPVVGLADASAHAAEGRRFGVVTGGAAWGPMLAEFFGARGYGATLAGVRTVAPTGAEIARDPAAALDALARACTDCVVRDGAEVVILGGAGLAGLAARVQHGVPVPVLCSVTVGVAAVLRAGPSNAPTRHAMETRGLSLELARLFA